MTSFQNPVSFQPSTVALSSKANSQRANRTFHRHSSASRTHVSALVVILFIALFFSSFVSVSAHSTNSCVQHNLKLYELSKLHELPVGVDMIRNAFQGALSKDIAELPHLSAEKIKLEPKFLMTVDPSDMTAPIMSGVRKVESDDRHFLAIKVKNTKTNKISTQVFHHKYANREKGVDYSWTTFAGPIVTTSNQILNVGDTIPLQRLFRGETVRVGEDSFQLTEETV